MDRTDAIRAEANREDGWPYPDDDSDMRAETFEVQPSGSDEEDDYEWPIDEGFDPIWDDIYGDRG
jgi:hypothetical protein